MLSKIKKILIKFLDFYRRLGYKNVHPTCHIGGNVRVFCKDNLVMDEHTNINAGSVIMNTRAKFIMRKYSGAAMNLFVVTGNHMSVPGLNKREVTDAVKDEFDINHEYDQDVIVEEDVWIGANVMLLAGTYIGRGAIVGAGSVVRGKVPPYSIVSGNPAKVTSYRFRLDEIAYHESKLYDEDERLSKELLENEYFSFYGRPKDVYKDKKFTVDDYREVFHRVFGVEPNCADTLEAYLSDEWDSLGQTRLTVELEKTFGVRISTEDARRFRSFTSGLEILRELNVNFNEEKIAYVFPGQGSQYSGMGKELYDSNPQAKVLFERANEILGFRITDVMFYGTDEDLRRTEVTQPAVFLCSVIPALVANIKPAMVAGHSLGEFSALVISGVLTFEDALRLVSIRAKAMQEACDVKPGTMAAVIQKDIVLNNAKLMEICQSVDGIVVPANYNCPGQVIISGENYAVDEVSRKLINYGVCRIIPLKVGGAFHSPLMEPARKELAKAIDSTKFNDAFCPIYQNVDAKAHTNCNDIKVNLISQLTTPVKWDSSIIRMITDGATSFVECGPGNVLRGLIAKIDSDVKTEMI